MKCITCLPNSSDGGVFIWLHCLEVEEMSLYVVIVTFSVLRVN